MFVVGCTKIIVTCLKLAAYKCEEVKSLSCSACCGCGLVGSEFLAMRDLGHQDLAISRTADWFFAFASRKFLYVFVLSLCFFSDIYGVQTRIAKSLRILILRGLGSGQAAARMRAVWLPSPSCVKFGFTGSRVLVKFQFCQFGQFFILSMLSVSSCQTVVGSVCPGEKTPSARSVRMTLYE